MVYCCNYLFIYYTVPFLVLLFTKRNNFQMNEFIERKKKERINSNEFIIERNDIQNETKFVFFWCNANCYVIYDHVLFICYFPWTRKSFLNLFTFFNFLSVFVIKYNTVDCFLLFSLLPFCCFIMALHCLQIQVKYFVI